MQRQTFGIISQSELYLALNKHRHVHEHIMKFFNWLFQFHNIMVSGFDVSQRLFGLLSVSDNLKSYKKI